MVEWNKDSCVTLNANKGDGFALAKNWNVLNEDIRNIDFASISDNIEVVTGGPPCQPFSIGGKSRAYNDHRDMFPEAIRAIREIRPKAFIFENVKGILRSTFSSYFDYIIKQLERPDLMRKDDESWEQHYYSLKKRSDDKTDREYNVTYHLFNAADYGVPQLRHRVFIVGFRNDLNKTWVPPTPTHSKASLLYSMNVSGEYWRNHDIRKNPTIGDKRIQEPTLQPWLTVRDAIEDLPDPSIPNNVPNHEYRVGARPYPGHSGSVLDWPSKTIKAGDHGVPGGENMVILDDNSVRYYTVRESARIQTFPDNYRFYTSWTESMRQIGNAVPVKLARIVGDSVFKELM